jgi:hypothetical protein
MRLAPGERLGPYVVESEIGAGRIGPTAVMTELKPVWDEYARKVQ